MPTSTKIVQAAKEVAIGERVCQFDSLEWEWNAARAAMGREEGVMRDFAERVRTGYFLLVCAQAWRYCERLNDVLDDAELRGKCLGV